MKRFLIAVGTAMLVSAAVADAAVRDPKPHPPFWYSGTIIGSQTTVTASGTTTTDNWTISSFRMRRGDVKRVDGVWTAVFKVTGGWVTFNEVATGRCQHSITDAYALRPALTRFNVSPLIFTKRGEIRRAIGAIQVSKSYQVTDRCTADDGTPYQGISTVDAPTLMSLGHIQVRGKAPPHLHFVVRQTSTLVGATTKQTWDLTFDGHYKR